MITPEQREKFQLEIGKAEREVNGIIKQLRESLDADVLVNVMDVGSAQDGTESIIQLIGQLSLRGVMPKPQPIERPGPE